MYTIQEITRLATMLAGQITPRLCLGFVLALPQLRLDYALVSISCEHCRSSRNNPHCAPRHVIYYYLIWYWSSSQFYNIVDVNYIFTKLLNFIDSNKKKKFNLLKALSALRNTFLSWHSRSIFYIHFSNFLVIYMIKKMYLLPNISKG